MPPPLPVQLPVGSKTMTEHPGFKLREKWRGVVHEPAAAPRRSEGGGGSLWPPSRPEKQPHDARPAERAAEDARADPAGGVRLPLAGKVARGEQRAGLRV